MINDKEFKAVYDEYKNLVYNLALNYVQNTSEAEDITQDVFVKIHLHFHKYDPATASLKTWIYRITINQCLDFVKAQKTNKRFAFIIGLFHPGSNEAINEAAESHHPGIAAEHKEEIQNLLKLINELPHNQKTILLLIKIDGRPQREVAEIMNMSVKAVESLLQRAKQNLEKKLKKSEGI